MIIDDSIADGMLLCIINLDAVTSAKPAGDDMLLVHAGDSDYRVGRAEFEKAISEKDSDISTICSAVNRLTLAMERLTVHIPTSIRMHL